MAILYETYGLSEACKHIGCGRSTLLKLAQQKKIASFTVAGKLRFPVQGLDDYINHLAEKSMKEVKL